MNEPTRQDVARMLDHSLLQPQLTDTQLEEGLRWAAGAGVASVCIKPYAVPLAAELLAGSGVAVCTVVGFPQGGHSTTVKVFESEQMVADGATELDMVVNIGKVLSEDWDYVRADVAAVVDCAHDRDAIVKVIFENSMLQDVHKVRLCEICTDVGTDFVKTATGYGDGGATTEDLKLMRKHAGDAVGVKAAGGVRNLDRVLEVRELGVTRIGATASQKILEEAQQRLPA